MSQPEHDHPPMEFTPLKHGQFCWTEIATNDADKCMEFYSASIRLEVQKGRWRCRHGL